MNGSKVWYTSRGMVGPLVAAIFAVLAGFDIDFGVDQQAVTDAVLTVGAVVAAIIGMQGRAQATKRVTLRKED